MSFDKSDFLSLLKSIVISLLFTSIAILFFGLILKWFSLSNEVIKPINYLIKILSVFVACYFSIKGDGGLLKGLIFGLVICVVTYLFFSLLQGEFSLTITTLWDVLLSCCFGGIAGVVAVNKKSNK